MNNEKDRRYLEGKHRKRINNKLDEIQRATKTMERKDLINKLYAVVLDVRER